MNEVIGDLGCAGVDLARFRATNRAPVYLDHWNRWVIARTTRDDPSRVELERYVAAFFQKIMRPYGWDPTAMVARYSLDTGQPTTRHQNVDLLHICKVETTQPAFAPSSLARQPSGKPAGREWIEPTITIRGKTPPLFIWVAFAWRGVRRTGKGPIRSIPWPVHKQQMLNSDCPTNADWALWAVLPPLGMAPPELTSLEKATRTVTRATVPSWLTPQTVAIGAGFGLFSWWLLTRD